MTLLQPSPDRYADSCGKGGLRNEDLCDERVSLPGPLLKDWVVRWHTRGNRLTEDNFLGGLASVMSGFTNWCRACEVLAIHASPRLQTLPRNNLVGGVPTRFPAHDYWGICQGDAQISRWMGPAPHAALRLNGPDCTPCPAHQRSPGTSASGACQACASGEIVVGNGCVACLDGSTPISGADMCQCRPHQVRPDPLNCQNCPHATNSVVFAGMCEECRNGSSPHPTEERCVCVAGTHQDNRGLNCDGCGAGQIFVARTGMCTNCSNGASLSPAEERCACGPQFENNADGLCTPCPAGSIVVAGRCQPCNLGSSPAAGEDRCECGPVLGRNTTEGLCRCVPGTSQAGNACEPTCSDPLFRFCVPERGGACRCVSTCPLGSVEDGLVCRLTVPEGGP